MADDDTVDESEVTEDLEDARRLALGCPEAFPHWHHVGDLVQPSSEKPDEIFYEPRDQARRPWDLHIEVKEDREMAAFRVKCTECGDRTVFDTPESLKSHLNELAAGTRETHDLAVWQE